MRATNTGVTGSRQTPIFLAVIFNPRVRKTLDYHWGIIRRPVIYNDDLEMWVGLPQCTSNRCTQVMSLVKSRDDNAH